MQINSGSVTVTNGSALIYTLAASGGDWTEVTQGSLFMLEGTGASYIINSDATYNSGAARWEALLSTDYVGPAPNTLGVTATTTDYAIVRDFTKNHNLPLIASGDVETATIYTRAMQLIDEALVLAATTGSGSSPVTYTLTTHGFSVGSALTLDGSGTFILANSLTEATSRIVGIVSATPTADTFTLQTDGFLGGLSGLTPGSVYFLKTYAGSPAADNYSTSTFTLKIPLFFARSATSIIILGLASAAASPMSGASGVANGTGGTVPTPVAGDNVKFLRGDGTWASAVPALSSLTYGQFATTPAFTTADWLSLSSAASPANMLGNLNTRLRSVEEQITDYPYMQVFTAGDNLTDPTGGTNSHYWTAPSGVTEVRVIAIGGGGGGTPYLSNAYYGGGGAGEYHEALLTVVPSSTYFISVGKGGASNVAGAFISAVNGENSYVRDPSMVYLISALGGASIASAAYGTNAAGGSGGSLTGTLILQRAGGAGVQALSLGVDRFLGGRVTLPSYAAFLANYGGGGGLRVVGANKTNNGLPGVVVLYWR